MDDKTNLEAMNKEKTGIKHLIECNCVLPQFKNRKNPVWHKFPVFSIIDEDDQFVVKFVQCNNCGIIHKVKEVGTSEITTKDNVNVIRKIEDIRMGLPDNIVGILEQYKCDLPIWEEVEFIIDEQQWNSYVVLSREEMTDGTVIGKMMLIKGPSLIKIESFSRQDYIG